MQAIKRKAKCSKCSGLEISEHGIRDGDQTFEQSGTGVAAQIHTQRTMVAVRPGEGITDQLIGVFLSQPVRVRRALDLDDLCAQVTEEPAQFPARDDDAKIGDTNALEGPGSHLTGGHRCERRRQPVCFTIAQGGGRRAKARACTVDNPVAAGDPCPHSGSQFGVNECTDLGEMFGLQDVGRGEHRGDWHAEGLTVGDQLVHRLIGEERSDEGSEFTEGTHPGGNGVEPRVLELLRLPQPRPQPMPLPRGHHTQSDIAVATGEDRIRVLILRSAPPAIGPVARGRGLTLGAERRIQCQHHGIEPGEVDVVPGAAAQPIEIGHQHRPRRLDRRGGRGDTVRWQHRRSRGGPGPRQGTRHRVEHRIGGAPGGPRAFGSEIGDPHGDQMLEPIGQCLAGGAEGGRQAG